MVSTYGSLYTLYTGVIHIYQYGSNTRAILRSYTKMYKDVYA